jgi:hypothetical protein
VGDDILSELGRPYTALTLSPPPLKTMVVAVPVPLISHWSSIILSHCTSFLDLRNYSSAAEFFVFFFSSGV